MRLSTDCPDLTSKLIKTFQTTQKIHRQILSRVATQISWVKVKELPNSENTSFRSKNSVFYTFYIETKLFPILNSQTILKTFTHGILLPVRRYNGVIALICPILQYFYLKPVRMNKYCEAHHEQHELLSTACTF